MWRKIVLTTSALVLAILILSISILRTASVRYEFYDVKRVGDQKILGETDERIDYFLVFPGNVLPDSPLWPLKALRDRLWLSLTTNPSRKAELKLLFADKRLGSAQILFERNKPEIGLSTLTKAEKYLEEAGNQEEENRKNGLDTSEFLDRYSKASLKHYQVMEEITKVAPEDAMPTVIETEVYAKNAFELSRNALLEQGLKPPENPFDWK
jgi:hypothetical protein